MKAISLEHLQPLACEAYVGLVIFPEKRADSVIREFTTDLNDDIRNIRNVVAPAIASENLEAIISKYHQRYEFHLTAWLQSSIEHKSAFMSPVSASKVTGILDRRKLVRNKYNHFREWRQRTVNMLTNGMKQTQIQKRSNERKRIQQAVNPGRGPKYIKRR